MEVDVTPKFETTVRRTMTVAEAYAKATAMCLSQKVIDFIVKEFDCAVFEMGPDGWTNPDDPTSQGVGEEGRIAFGQNWDSVYEELLRVMGFPNYADLSPDQEAAGERVWNAFFEE